MQQGIATARGVGIRELALATAALVGLLPVVAGAAPVTKEYRVVVSSFTNWHTGWPILPPLPTLRGYFRFTFDPDEPDAQILMPDAVDFSIAGVTYGRDSVEVSTRRFEDVPGDPPNYKFVIGGTESSVLAMAPGTDDFMLGIQIDSDGRESFFGFIYSVRPDTIVYSGLPQFEGAADVPEPSSLWLLILGAGAAIVMPPRRASRRRRVDAGPGKFSPERFSSRKGEASAGGSTHS